MKINGYILLGLLVLIGIRYKVVAPYVVSGLSMYPTFDNGDLVFVHLWDREPCNGDIVGVTSPDTSEPIVKRVIASGGDRLVFTESTILVNDKVILHTKIRRAFKPSTIIFARNTYFLLGDNFLHSTDSTDFGPVGKDRILGKIVKN